VLVAAWPARAEQAPEPVPGAPVFVRLPLFVIPVIEGGEVTRQVTVGVALELAEGQTTESIEPKRPVLIDAFFKELYGMFAQRSGAGRIADDQTIKVRLGRVTDSVLGPGVVKQILIQQLFERERPK
jgi:flagellar basal body-associated protein FliL